MKEYDTKDEALDAICDVISRQVKAEYAKEIDYLYGLCQEDIANHGTVLPATWRSFELAYKGFIREILKRSKQ
jgi:hypothetical protein